VLRRRRMDLIPTYGIAITVLTAYLTYTSLRLDKAIREGEKARAIQAERDAAAAQNRIDIAAKSDRRNKQLGTIISLLGVVVLGLTIKGVVL
jgi:hypothetical protein